MCMSVQKPQPLIWLALSFTSSCVAAGRVELWSTAAAELMCLTRFMAIGLPRKSIRAFIVSSLRFGRVTA